MNKKRQFDFHLEIFDRLSNLVESNSFDGQSSLLKCFVENLQKDFLVEVPSEFSFGIGRIEKENDFWLNRTLIVGDEIELISSRTSDEVFRKFFNRSILVPFRRRNEIFLMKKLDELNGETNTNFSMRVENQTVFHLISGSNVDETFRRLTEENLSTIEKSVWQRERRFLIENDRTSNLHSWSKSEIDELIENGYLINYKVFYRHEPRLYPEIVDDPSNFIVKNRI